MEPLTELLNLSSHAAHWPGLRPIGALLEHLARYIAILPIVIFRAEIRRLLSGLNRALALLRPLEKDSLDEIARAAEYLSQNRIGALIVLERKTKLRTYVGTAIDASLSYDLLISLFKWSPLHDGAVIIKDTRVAVARCFLPSSLPLFSKQLGFRHNVAVSISKQTDAVAVVVSEERGTISLAIAGDLETPLTPDQLSSRLNDLFAKDRSMTGIKPGSETPWLSSSHESRADA